MFPGQMDHRFLRFNPNNSKENACIPLLDQLWERRTNIDEPRRLSWALMEQLNQSERLQEMLSAPWARLINIEMPIYLELTLEFFASYKLKKPKHTPVDFFNKQHGIKFRLGGRWHHWSIAKLGRKLGIYTDDDLDTNMFMSMYEFPTRVSKIQAWNEIADDDREYSARSSKASKLRDPLWRVLHKVFVHTLCGRGDSLGNVPTADLLCVYSIATQTPINLAQRIAEFWVDSAGKLYNSKICGGEYVSKIAESLGLLTPENVQSMTLDNTGTIVDLRALQNMGMIIHTAAGNRLLGRNQVVWDPIPVAPEQVEPLQQHLGHGHGDEEEHAHEHGQEHPHVHDEGHGFGMGGFGGFQGGQGEGFHAPEFGGTGMPSQTQNLPSYGEFYEQFS